MVAFPRLCWLLPAVSHILREVMLMTDPLYHEGNRTLQDKFDSRRIADRLEQVTLHDTFMPHDVEMIENADMFFLATADAGGRPDVSYKGGLPGFVRVISEDTLAFPAYDGNGMFKSFGNILVNPNVASSSSTSRTRTACESGKATISDDDPLFSNSPALSSSSVSRRAHLSQLPATSTA